MHTQKKMKKIIAAMVVIIVSVVTGALKSSAQDEIYPVQAMFIHNFIKYIEWPASTQQTIVGVVNDQYVVNAFSQRLNTDKTQVKNFKSLDNIETCQIIFIPSTHKGQLSKVLEKVKGKPVLVVTEDPDMTVKGAGISFKIIGERLKFQINQEVIKNEGMKVASSLLSLSVN